LFTTYDVCDLATAACSFQFYDLFFRDYKSGVIPAIAAAAWTVRVLSCHRLTLPSNYVVEALQGKPRQAELASRLLANSALSLDAGARLFYVWHITCP
jgi:hypothetical protein